MVSKKLEVYYPEDSVINVFAAPKKHLKDNHARHFSNEMLSLAIDKSLSGNDLRVFLAIVAYLEFENIVNISQQELSEQLKINRPAVAKSIKKLISKGYLQIINKIGRRNIYMFNPSVAFKSRAKNLKELKHSWDSKNVPNTQKYPIDIDTDLEPGLEEKLDYKVEELSKQYNVPQSKVRQIILSLVDQALTSDQEEPDVPY